jgi:F-type H+-transporting ATPase subunit b
MFRIKLTGLVCNQLLALEKTVGLRAQQHIRLAAAVAMQSKTQSAVGPGSIDPVERVRKFEPLDPAPTNFKEFPERDIVNFPHYATRLYRPKVRMGFIPQSWFEAIYPKTGDTGPFILMAGIATLIVQKEWIRWEPDLVWNLHVALMLYLVHRFGFNPVSRFFDEQTDLYVHNEKKSAKDEADALQSVVDKENLLQKSYNSMSKYIFDAKRELVDLQLEAEYRRRVDEVATEVKNKVDYLTAVEEEKSRFERKHMVQWIIDEVRKSITPDQEKAILQQCMVDLKGLAAKA